MYFPAVPLTSIGHPPMSDKVLVSSTVSTVAHSVTLSQSRLEEVPSTVPSPMHSETPSQTKVEDKPIYQSRSQDKPVSS